MPLTDPVTPPTQCAARRAVDSPERLIRAAPRHIFLRQVSAVPAHISNDATRHQCDVEVEPTVAVRSCEHEEVGSRAWVGRVSKADLPRCYSRIVRYRRWRKGRKSSHLMQILYAQW